MSVKLPTGIETINQAMFQNCKALEKIVIPTGVKTIKSFAFSECHGLTLAVIPSTVTDIEINAFENCKTLTDVYCYAESVPTTSSAAFTKRYTSVNTTLHIPAASIDDYKVKEPWMYFNNFLSLVDTDPYPTAIKPMIQDNLMTPKCYDIQGRVVKQPRKGICIVNGKKYIMAN